MLEEMEALSYPDMEEPITLDNIDSQMGPRIIEPTGSQIAVSTMALLRKSIEGKKEFAEKKARRSDGSDSDQADLEAKVKEMKEKIEAAYQAELNSPKTSPEKEGKKKTPEKGECRKGPPELIPLMKKSLEKKIGDVCKRKSADETVEHFHGIGKEFAKRKSTEDKSQTKEQVDTKDRRDSANENDIMDIDVSLSEEQLETEAPEVVEPEVPPKPVRIRPKSKAEIKRIKREKDRLRREAKKLAALEALKAPPPNPSEEDTRMSASDPTADGLDDSFGFGIKKNRMEVGDPEGKEFTVEHIAEYQWPLQGGELYMVQEQISTYLGVKSFKRKYPDLKRRTVEMEEKTFLLESGLVSESMCDLGLTAVSSSEVLDIMFQDFQEQYEELRKHMREKAARELIYKQKERKKFEQSLSKSDLKEHAIQSALNWNQALNRGRTEGRRCHLDLQTWTVQYPRGRGGRVVRPTPRPGHYPVSLIPGQYSDYYKRYTPQELRYWPVNTVLYGPLQPNERNGPAGSEGSQSESEDSSSSDDSSDSSSEGEGSGDEREDCKLCGGATGGARRAGAGTLQCSQCGHHIHVSCAELNPAMLAEARKYAWQCSACKTCQRCNKAKNESKMLFCDVCDRGYHIYCVGLRRVPAGSWTCHSCLSDSG